MSKEIKLLSSCSNFLLLHIFCLIADLRTILLHLLSVCKFIESTTLSLQSAQKPKPYLLRVFSLFELKLDMITEERTSQQDKICSSLPSSVRIYTLSVELESFRKRTNWP